ncbi:Glycosyltransferase, GT2 family [Sediminibacterium ginsengisoli]|uniref:Glycosyltransferase, GT2 family n=2 Tax=Sediminibacterium ginsengisoli TaxID=413434 RepID=A0A1T4Q5Y7_9BACT|nr:Glycosyltransferase, GT2 family [Sediminibacterium ginsengisoli]
MKILIGITSRNRCAVLPKAIESALSQTYGDKHVVIFDDASTDGTKLLKENFTAVEWILSGEQKGLMYARNLFLTLHDAVYFCSLDDDAWFLDANTLLDAVQYMDRNEDVAALAFDILSPDDHNRVQKENIITETNNYIGCGHLLRIRPVLEAGGYFTTPGYYGSEEKDLCIRLMNNGYKIMKSSGWQVWHDKTSISRNIKAQHESGVCNDLVFMWRRTPLLLLLPALFSKFYKHLAFSATYENEKLLLPCLNGMKRFFRFLFTFKTGRKAVSLSTFKKYIRLNQ